MQKLAVLLFAAASIAAAWACAGRAPNGEDAGAPPPADGGVQQDGGSSTSDGGTSGLSLESACGVLNGRRCAYLQRCELIPPGADSRRDCELYFATVDCGPGGWPALVREGTLRYDGVKAQACAEGWTAQACRDFQTEPAACGQITSPAALFGGVCYGGPAAECTRGVCTGGTCPRECRAPGTEGEVCEADGDCESGLYCQRTVSGGAIGTCALFGESGDPCGPSRPCAEGFVCGSFAVCQAVAKIGDPCTAGACEQSAFCAWGTDGGTCMARLAEGDTCSDDEQCRSALLCLNETGQCADPGPLAQGEPCARRQSCEEGLACVGTRPDPHLPPSLGACTTPIARGGACTSSWDCEPPLACALDGADGGVCTSRLAEGAACVEDRDCGLFSRCSNASCVRIPRVGEPCPSGECLYGTCGSDPDGGTLCQGLGGPNAACQRDEQCASLRCVAGACLAACSP